VVQSPCWNKAFSVLPLNATLKRSITTRLLLIAVCLALVFYAGWCGITVYKISKERAKIKEHYSAVNNITFGLLSVNAWRDHVSQIINNRIEDFNFTPQERDTLEYEISGILHAMVDEAASMLEKKPKNLGGKLKRFAVKTLVKEDAVHKKVPQFSSAIVSEIMKKKHRSKLKFLAQNKLKEVESITYDSVNDVKTVEKILKDYNAKDIVDFNQKTEGMRNGLQDETYSYTYQMAGILLLFLLGWWLLRKQRQLHTPFFVMSVLLALIVLLTGLTTPMIEIDARIKELSFTLVGEKIMFNDQVIFYQSKSIVDVVKILIETRKVDSVIVGLLILAFSILFPIGKLAATQIYLLGKDKLKNKRIVQYFAFKSGKWSMADVIVVAIFMAYIGFKGILDTQLATMNVKTDSLASVSTNQTSLQPGFILFVAFVVFSLILSEILHRTVPPPVEKLKG
jgi:hypothetical protein